MDSSNTTNLSWPHISWPCHSTQCHPGADAPHKPIWREKGGGSRTGSNHNSHDIHQTQCMATLPKTTSFALKTGILKTVKSTCDRSWFPSSNQAITAFVFLGGWKFTCVACDFIGCLKKKFHICGPEAPQKKSTHSWNCLATFLWKKFADSKIRWETSASLILNHQDLVGFFGWRSFPLWILLLIMLLHHLSQCGHKSLAWCG